MPPTQPPLKEVLPPLVCGTATFNSQYNTDPYAMPTTAIVEEALKLGVRAFDTSPYYGPSELLLGSALTTPYVQTHHPRSSYTLITKVGRLTASTFDYSPTWVRASIQNSLARLHTPYLDLVYCHDVEFVTPTEVLLAIRELQRIRDEEGTIRYIGISGYPVPVLCEIAEMILQETGEPLDAVMSYANFTLQNTTLRDVGMERLRLADVGVVLNASPLGMGLLRGVGVPVGGKGDFHPAPRGLREVCLGAAEMVGRTRERLETVAIRWALEEWAREGAGVGGIGGIGVSVMGVSKVEELAETMSVWDSVLDGLDVEGRVVDGEAREWSRRRREEVAVKARGVWEILGQWKDYVWPSPEEGFVNMRVMKGVVDEVETRLVEVSQPLESKDSRL